MAEFQPLYNEKITRSLVNSYKQNPKRFTPERTESLRQHANYHNVPFYEGEFSIADALTDLGTGFIEGFTTLHVGDPPDNEYEAIFKNIGHLAGFAPGIIAAPLGAAAKLTKSTSLLTAAKVARGLNDKSVPMFAAKHATAFAKKNVKPFLKQGRLGKQGAVATASSFILGNKARHIAEGAFHLGTASAVSSWQGGVDQMMSSFVQGGIAGGVFRSIGNYVNTGSEAGNKVARTLSGSLFMGLPSTIQGATTPEQVYQYLMGAWFGGKERPWTVAKAGKFMNEYVKDIESGKMKELRVAMDPEEHPNFKNLPEEVKPVAKEMFLERFRSPEENREALWYAAEKMGIDLEEAANKLVDLGSYEEVSTAEGTKVRLKKGELGAFENFIITTGQKGLESFVAREGAKRKDRIANIHMVTDKESRRVRKKELPGIIHPLTDLQLSEANEAMTKANNRLKKKEGNLSSDDLNLIRKNYFVVKNADELFISGKFRVFKNPKTKQTWISKTQLEGAPGWAAQMAVDMGKPIHLYEVTQNKWFKYHPSAKGFGPQTPKTIPKRAGFVGGRYLSKPAKEAFRTLLDANFPIEITPKEVKEFEQIEKDDKDSQVSDPQVGIVPTSDVSIGKRIFRFANNHLNSLFDGLAPGIKQSKELEVMSKLVKMAPEYINRGLPENRSEVFLDKIIDEFDLNLNPQQKGEAGLELRQFISRRNSDLPLIHLSSDGDKIMFLDRANPVTKSGQRKINREPLKIVDSIWQQVFGKEGRAHAVLNEISVRDKKWKDMDIFRFRNSKKYGEKAFNRMLSRGLKHLSKEENGGFYYYGGKGTDDRLYFMKYHPKTNDVKFANVSKFFKGTDLNNLRDDFVKKFVHREGMTPKQAKEYFDKAFKSNILWSLSTNGLEYNDANIKKLISDGFISNATNWNKRSQIWLTDSYAGEKEFYADKLADMSKNGNFRYMIVPDLSNAIKKLDHRDVSLDSNQNPEFIDGAVLSRRDVLTLNNMDAGTGLNATQNKSFIISPNAEKGALLGKYMMHDAGKSLSNYMKEQGIHYIIQESAAKQMGLRQYNTVYNDLDPSHIKFNYSVKQDNNMIRPQSVKKQILNTLVESLSLSPNTADGVKMDDIVSDIFNTLIEPRYRGTKKANDDLEIYLSKIKTASDSELIEAVDALDFENIGLDRLVRATKKAGNEMFTRKAYDIMLNGRKQSLSEELAEGEITDKQYEAEVSELEDFSSITTRLLEEGRLAAKDLGIPESSIAVFVHPFINAYRMKVMSNWIVKQATKPKMNNSGGARIRPYDHDLQMDSDNVNARLKDLNKDDSLFFLDSAYEDMMIHTNIKGIGKIKLNKFWKMYEKGLFDKQPEIKKQVEEIFRSVVSRVPMDSISGAQVLKFSGFTGREGHGILMHSRAMRALGGADLDGDVAYFYMGGEGGFKKSWKDMYEANKSEYYEMKYVDKKAEGKYDRVDAFGVTNQDWIDKSNIKLKYKPNSYYRGGIGNLVIDKNGNLILRGKTDSMFEEHFPGKGKGTSVTGDLTQAREHALIRHNYELKRLEEYMDSFGAEESEIERWQENILERGLPYLIRIDKNVFDKLAKGYEKLSGQDTDIKGLSGEARVVFDDKIIIPKGEWEQYTFKPSEGKYENDLSESGFGSILNSRTGEGVFGKVGKTIVTDNKDPEVAKDLVREDDRAYDIESLAAMFAPNSRLEIANAAIEGRALLGGAAVSPKQVMASAYNVIQKRGSDKFEITRKVWNKFKKKNDYIPYEVEIKARTSPKEKKWIRVLTRTMMGLSADPMDYAGLKSYEEWWRMMYNAHFEITSMTKSGKKVKDIAKEFENLKPYEFKAGGILGMMEKANSAYYGRDYVKNRAFSMDERQDMTRDLVLEDAADINTMTPKIARLLHGIDYSDNSLTRANQELVESLYTNYKETVSQYDFMKEMLGRTSFKLPYHKYVQSTIQYKLFNSVELDKVVNDPHDFKNAIYGTSYQKMPEKADKFNQKKNPKRWYIERVNALRDIRDKASIFLMNDLTTLVTVKRAKNILDKMSPEELENVGAIHKSTERLKRDSYLMARVRHLFDPDLKSTSEIDKLEEIYEALLNDPEFKNTNIAPLKGKKALATAELDQAQIDAQIRKLKRTSFTTKNQHDLFDNLLLGSLNRGDLEAIDRFESKLDKIDELTYQVLSGLRNEAARTSVSRLGYSSTAVEPRNLREFIGDLSKNYMSVIPTRTGKQIQAEGNKLVNEPQKQKNIEQGMPEDFVRELEDFLVETTGWEGIKKPKKKFELDAETKSYIDDVIAHLKLENNSVTRDFNFLVRELLEKDVNLMNKSDWLFMKTWFDDIKRGTLWQRLKKKKFTELSQRHYMQFPETINRELMKDEIILMQKQGVFLTADGVMKIGKVAKPTQYMDIIMEWIGRTNEVALGKGDELTNDLNKRLTFLDDMTDSKALHDIAIAFREQPLVHKINGRKEKSSAINWADAESYNELLKNTLKEHDYESSIKDRIYTITKPVEQEDGTFLGERVRLKGSEAIKLINETYTDFFRKMHDIVTGDVPKDKMGNVISPIPKSLEKYIIGFYDAEHLNPIIDHKAFINDLKTGWMKGEDIPMDFGVDGVRKIARSMMIEMTGDKTIKEAMLKSFSDTTGKIDFKNYWPHMHFNKKAALEALEKYTKHLRLSELPEEEVNEILKRMTYRHHALTGDWFFEDMDDWKAFDTVLEEISKNKLTKEGKIQWFNSVKKAGSMFSREAHLPGWSLERTVPGGYAKSIINNYFRQMAQIFSRNSINDFSKAMYSKFGKEQTNAWTTFLKLYVQGAMGNPDVISDEILKDPAMKIQGTPYAWWADNRVRDRVNKIGDKLGLLNKNLPENLRGLDVNDVRWWSNLEAKYELASLLAHPKSVVNNIFGGTLHTIQSTGLKTFLNARNYQTLAAINPKWNSKQAVDDFVVSQGVLPEFLQAELALMPEYRSAKAKDTINAFAKKITRDPNISKESIIDIAKRGEITKPLAEFAAKFMSVPERALRRDAFMAHYLHWYNKFGGAIKEFDHPILVELAKKGVKATQFLYSAPYRPMFARTGLGKIMTRFQLWGWNAVRFRKEAIKQAKLYGFKGAEADRAARMMQLDLLVFGFGNAFAYSLFDTAMPAPWNWLQDTSEWIFGDEKERNRAFFGQWPRAVAPLQTITPPILRLPMASVRGFIEDDWSKVADYYIYTVLPFGRIVRDFHAKNNLIENPGGLIDKWTGLPAIQLTKASKELRKGEERIVPTPGAFY